MFAACASTCSYITSMAALPDGIAFSYQFDRVVAFPSAFTGTLSRILDTLDAQDFVVVSQGTALSPSRP